jgi:hypothetical protein
LKSAEEGKNHVTEGGTRKCYVTVNGRERRDERGRGYNLGWLEACIMEYNLGHKHGSAPHTYDLVVLTSLTHPRKILLVVLQIGKAKDLSAPLHT